MASPEGLPTQVFSGRHFEDDIKIDQFSVAQALCLGGKLTFFVSEDEKKKN